MYVLVPSIARSLVGLWALYLLPSLHAAPVVSHVIHISLDGLRGDLLASFIETAPLDFPNFKRFVDQGATTFNARTDYTSTVTLPNHTSMITGRPVDRPAGAANTVYHGYIDDSASAATTLHNSGNPNVSYMASTFDVAHDNGQSTALYAAKAKFNLFPQSYSETTGAPDLIGPDNGRDKIDRHFITEDFLEMHNALLADLATYDFNYTFLHHNLLDGVGHNGGWESAAWQSAVQFLDGYLGDIFALLESDLELAHDTAIILTSDHGGTGTSHGSPTEPANYTIPVLVWGPGVAPGADLYALNPHSRLEPGTGRPAYTQPVQPIRNGDTGNLALQLLGLGPVAGSTINAQQDLAVASAYAADFDANQIVDALDLAIWKTGYGATALATVADGDANLDGRVDGRDLLLWQREAGAHVKTHSTAAPEPGCLALLLIAVAWVPYGLFHRGPFAAPRQGLVTRRRPLSMMAKADWNGRHNLPTMRE